jgi:hypothetical protein
VHPQYEGYHGQDINQADVVLMQWPLNYRGVSSELAKASTFRHLSAVCPF